MSISTINSTSLRANNVSFGAKRHDNDRKEKNKVVKIGEKLLVAAGATAISIGGTSYLSGRLLSKINNNATFANKVGELAYSGYEKLVGKVFTTETINDLVAKTDSERNVKKLIAQGKLIVAKAFNKFVEYLPEIANGKGKLAIKPNTIINALNESVAEAAKKIPQFKDMTQNELLLASMVQRVIDKPADFEAVEMPLVQIIKKVVANSQEADVNGLNLSNKVASEFEKNYKGQNFVKTILSYLTGLAAGVAGLTDPDHNGQITSSQALENIATAAVNIAVS